MKSEKRSNALVPFLNSFRRPAKPPSISMPHSSAVESVTSSRITVEEVSGSHLFKIERYSVQKLNDRGQFLDSATFRVGEYDWYIRYFPSGDSQAEDGDTSIFLCFEGENEVKARCTFTVLTSDGKQLSESRSGAITTFRKSAWGHSSFVRKSLLELGHLKDDCVVIKCTVSVVYESLQRCSFHN